MTERLAVLQCDAVGKPAAPWPAAMLQGPCGNGLAA